MTEGGNLVLGNHLSGSISATRDPIAGDSQLRTLGNKLGGSYETHRHSKII